MREIICTCWQLKTRASSLTPQRQSVPSASAPCSQKRASCSGSVCTPSAGLIQETVVALSYVKGKYDLPAFKESSTVYFEKYKVKYKMRFSFLSYYVFSCSGIV